MDTRTPSWFFPVTDDGEEKGLSDPGVEMFRNLDALARETCQNIGDARARDDAPAIATFEVVDLPIAAFPGRAQLRATLESCRDYLCGTDERRSMGKERIVLDRAIARLDGRYVKFLRIGDENTKGLVGGDADRQRPFFRLVRGQGVSSIEGDGAGTYGIGQRAPFAASDLRTVFYSTKIEDGKEAFVGKSVLASHPDPTPPGRLRQNIGWWSLARSGDLPWASLRDPTSIPPEFRRQPVGTDVWIAGYNGGSDWRTTIRDSVLIHFFAAVRAGRLEVRIVDEASVWTISSATLSDEMAKACESSHDSRLHLELLHAARYLRALDHPCGGKAFEKTIKNLGAVQLFVQQDPDDPLMPDRYCRMRKPRIVVDTQASRMLRRYAAVLLCESETGNALLAELEDPSHKKWGEEHARGWDDTKKKAGRAALDSLHGFVKDSLRSIAESRKEEEQDLPGLGRYLGVEDPVAAVAADDGSDATGSPATSETGAHLQPALLVPVRRTLHLPSRPPSVAVDDDDEDRDGDPDPDGTPKSGVTGPNKPVVRPDPDHTRKGKVGPGSDPALRTIPGRQVSARFFQTADGYELVLRSTTTIEGAISIVSLDDSDHPAGVPLLSARDLVAGKNLVVRGKRIEGVAVVQGQPTRIAVTLVQRATLCLALEG